MSLRSILSPLAALGLALVACQVETRSTSTADVTVMPEQIPIGDVMWYVDYEAAVEVARAEGKALWVHFGEDPG